MLFGIGRLDQSCLQISFSGWVRHSVCSGSSGFVYVCCIAEYLWCHVLLRSVDGICHTCRLPTLCVSCMVRFRALASLLFNSYEMCGQKSILFVVSKLKAYESNLIVHAFVLDFFVFMPVSDEEVTDNSNRTAMKIKSAPELVQLGLIPLRMTQSPLPVFHGLTTGVTGSVLLHRLCCSVIFVDHLFI